MLPSLPSLRAFDVAARTGSFRAAADELNVSPTAVSHHIRNLEGHLGVSLFDRVGRSVKLTEEGSRLAMATGQAFGLLEDTVSTFQRSVRNIVRVAAGPILTARWLMPRISDFWSSHPGIELEVVPSYRPHRLDPGDADIIIRWVRLADVPRGTPLLLALQPVAVASSDFIAREGPFLEPADLLKRPILHQRDHWGWKDWFDAMGVDATEHLRGPVFEDANILLRGAIEGQGATLGWLPLVEQDLAEGRIVRLFDEVITPTHGYVVEVPDSAASVRRQVRTVRDWLMEAKG
jgi:LysR family glycine cleavage system transcriptional activator